MSTSLSGLVDEVERTYKRGSIFQEPNGGFSPYSVFHAIEDTPSVQSLEISEALKLLHVTDEERIFDEDIFIGLMDNDKYEAFVRGHLEYVIAHVLYDRGNILEQDDLRAQMAESRNSAE